LRAFNGSIVSEILVISLSRRLEAKGLVLIVEKVFGSVAKNRKF